jgi:hypothetical protein
MGMHTHLSLLKEYGGVKSVYINNYGFISTRLYQELLLDETMQYVQFDEMPEEIWENDFILETMYVDENLAGDGSIEVHDMIKLLKRCEELFDSNADDWWLATDWKPLTEKLEAMVKSKVISENDTIEFKYW